MGRRRKRKPHERDVHGILLLDKPAGITSNDALQKIKRIYRAARAGHTGSLDKPATGMLPICLGEATKTSAYLLNADKTYIAVAKLGVVTNTADAEGEILETHSVPDFNQQNLEQVLAQFIGNIEQVPPMYSALKIDGQRLYKLAYQGVEVARQPRPVSIHQIDLVSFDHVSFEFQVRCSKGTYIRTLVEDIGNVLGCGAHVSTLRRLSTGPFTEEQMITIENVEKQVERGDDALDELLMPVDSALDHLPPVELSEDETYYLCLGQAVLVPYASRDKPSE
ncbi:MAG: tRNA pseudouridine(55) synthase TruB [Gammaproteobacteria bacterium]